MLQWHPLILVAWDLHSVEPNIATAFIDSWVASVAHNHISITSVVSVRLHGQE
jgi:hypothetical protein